MNNWFTLPIGEVLKKLEVSRELGLRDEEILIRRGKFGSNELTERGRRGPGRIFLDQFKETLVVVLMAAGLLSSFLGDFQDAIAIGIIIGLNALLGFQQE